MAKAAITVTVRVAWWAVVYIRTLLWLCKVFDAEPKEEAINRVLKRGVTLVAVNGMKPSAKWLAVFRGVK